MSYATFQDLVDRAGDAEVREIADRDGYGSAEPQEIVVAAALAEADRKIDAYLNVRYAVPLTVVPAIVKGWAVTIARYLLHRDGPPDHVVRDYRDVTAELKDAAVGRLALPDQVGAQPAQSNDGRTVSCGSEPAFTAEKMGGWL